MADPADSPEPNGFGLGAWGCDSGSRNLASCGGSCRCCCCGACCCGCCACAVCCGGACCACGRGCCADCPGRPCRRMRSISCGVGRYSFGSRDVATRFLSLSTFLFGFDMYFCAPGGSVRQG